MKNPLQHLSAYDIILGSGSPRRKELLSGLKLNYRIISSDAEEIIPEHITPREAPSYLADLKANDLLPGLKEDFLLITADTVVIINNQILGKPETKNEAARMLRTLSGTTHHVITGVCIQDKIRRKVFDDLTEVTFSEFSDDEIDWFINNFDIMDKAGAYGIQEGIGLSKISTIKGSYYNVMGLPTTLLYEQLFTLEQKIGSNLSLK